MSEENSVNSDLQRTIEPFLKSLGLNVPTILDGLAILQVYTKNLALTVAPLAKIDWATAKRRLDFKRVHITARVRPSPSSRRVVLWVPPPVCVSFCAASDHCRCVISIAPFS